MSASEPRTSQKTVDSSTAQVRLPEPGDYYHDAAGRLLYVVEVVAPEGEDPRAPRDPDNHNVLLEDALTGKADVFKVKDVVKLTYVERDRAA